jgi:hypothetical protein
MPNLETIQALKEIIVTLNLESQTTVEILKELMPLLWWKLIWMPMAITVFTVSLGVISFLVLWKLIDKEARKK